MQKKLFINSCLARIEDQTILIDKKINWMWKKLNI